MLLHFNHILIKLFCSRKDENVQCGWGHVLNKSRIVREPHWFFNNKKMYIIVIWNWLNSLSPQSFPGCTMFMRLIAAIISFFFIKFYPRGSMAIMYFIIKYPLQNDCEKKNRIAWKFIKFNIIKMYLVSESIPLFFHLSYTYTYYPHSICTNFAWTHFFSHMYALILCSN